MMSIIKGLRKKMMGNLSAVEIPNNQQDTRKSPMTERVIDPHSMETLRPFVDYLNAYFKATRREPTPAHELWG
jgi:hypothetical protein